MTRRISLPICFLSTLLLLGPLTVLATEVEQAKAIEIFNAAVLAHGGVQAISKVSDTVAVGQVRTFGADGTSETSRITASSRGADQLRSETIGPSLQHVYVSNGQVGTVIRNGARTRLSPYEVANNLTRINPLVGLLRAYLENRLTLAYKGTVSQNGIQHHQITARLADRDPERQKRGKTIDREFDVLIDAATSLITSISYAHQSIRGINAKARHEYRYSDYRRTEGLVVPFRVGKWLYQTKRAEILFESFRLTSLGPIFVEP